MVRLVEPLKDKLTQLEEKLAWLEQKVTDVKTSSLINQSQWLKDREYVDIHFSQMQQPSQM